MYHTLLEEVKTIVLEAARIIDDIREPKVDEKDGINNFVTEVDFKISEFLCNRLPNILEGSVAISEEGNIVNPQKGYYWIIDPLDGTSNFIYGNPDFAISVGLIKNGKAVLGVVYAPKRNEMFYAAEGIGAFCNKMPIKVCKDNGIKSTIVFAETNPYSERKSNIFPIVFRAFFKDCIDYRITGSAAIDCCYIACGRGGVYVAENLKPWDYAAGEIIVREAGGKVSQWGGESTKYFGGSTILATNGLLHDEVLNRLKCVYTEKC